jgi:hypothetical protein
VRPPVSHGRRHLPVVGRDLCGLPNGRAVCDRRRPAQLVEAKMAASIPDETAELVWQAAESLYILASCLRQGDDSFGPMAEAARALHVVADRFPVLLRDAG